MSVIKPGQWFRTCQECGNEQSAREPDTSKPLTDAYCNAKCRKCRSEALDYGTGKADPDYDWTVD